MGGVKINVLSIHISPLGALVDIYLPAIIFKFLQL